ncbi:MAG: extracellular solute-binding protein, partial [Oscillospiraceae bacterium]|nr:extracellular solute-binding protein [Oscillospiraceae bacterium]
MKKLLALILAMACMLTVFTACGGGETAEEDTPSVYYLNFKPEQDAQWQALAKAYTDETGVPVTVVTAASGEYETTLMAEMGKSEAPTLFQVNGPVGLANWKDYCYDFSGSEVYGQLLGDDFALVEDGKVYGLAYVIETYGIIANTKLLDKAGYKVEDIKSFADLKKVCEDIQNRKDELGFAAFSSAGMDSSSDWRFKTHLANLPLTFEYQTEGITPGTVKGTYLDNYRDIWDLYINYATCEPAELSAKTGNDAVTEMIDGKAVFY